MFKKNIASALVILILLFAIPLALLASQRHTTEHKNLFVLFAHKSGAPFGVQIDGPVASAEITASMLAAKPAVYQYPARWMCIEPDKPVNGAHTYVWDNSVGDCPTAAGTWREPHKDWLAENAEVLKDAYTIVGVKTAPEWARVYTDHIGSPPKPEYYDDYALAVNAVISKTRPWGVEIWNEPDSDCHSVEKMGANTGIQLGCWVHEPNPTAAEIRTAGCAYGKLLSVAYPIIKEAHPDVNVIGGALMNYGEPDSKWTQNFISGVFNTEDDAGYGNCGYGLSKADFVSLHQYRDWNLNVPPGDKKPGDLGWNNFPSVLQRSYSLYDEVRLPVILSETSMNDPRHGHGNNTDPRLLEYQYQYYRYLVKQWNEDKWRGKVVLIENYGLKNIQWEATDLIVGDLFKPSYDLIMQQLQKPRVIPYITPTPIPTWTPLPTPPTPIPTIDLGPSPYP